jgi:hypothetical protein
MNHLIKKIDVNQNKKIVQKLKPLLNSMHSLKGNAAEE